MKIDTIKARIENAQKKLDKLNKKMDRIKKAEASNWENNPYGYYEGDIKWTQRDIDEATEALEKYTTMLSEENDKASSRNVPVLVEFLDMWRDNARNWYNERRSGKDRKAAKAAYEKAKKQHTEYDNKTMYEEMDLRKKVAEELGAKSEYAEEVYNDERVVKFRTRTEKHSLKLKNAVNNAYDFYKENYEEIDNMEADAYYVVQKAGLDKIEAEYKAAHKKFRSWDHHIELTTAQKNKAWNTLLEKMLQDEWNRKYDRLLDDVIRITGTIDDASSLRINEKGDLDGFIYGKKGTAKINTFGAGGYNIQCFHYRTKITRVK